MMARAPYLALLVLERVKVQIVKLQDNTSRHLRSARPGDSFDTKFLEFML